MAEIDRVNGLVGTLGVKAPVRAATTANITLTGTQTVDGVALAIGDRVLVKDQTDATQNGLYYVESGAWTRAPDFDGARDTAKGTLILVVEGSTQADQLFRVNNSSITFGSSLISFIASAFSALALAASSGSSLVGFIQAGVGAVARTAQSKLRDTVHAADFGAVGDGITDDTTAIQKACATNQPVFLPITSNYFKVSALTTAEQNLLWGPGTLYVGGSQRQINTSPIDITNKLSWTSGYINSAYGGNYLTVNSGTFTGKTNGGSFECYGLGSGGVIDTLTGVNGYAEHRGSNTVNSAYGGRVAASNTGLGTVTDLIGLKINENTNTGGGSVPNNYGIFINATGIGTSHNSALHVFDSGTNGKISWGFDSNFPDAYFYNSATAEIACNDKFRVPGTLYVSTGKTYLDAAGNIFAYNNVQANGAISQKVTVGTAVLGASGTQTNFAIQNSKAVTFQLQGYGSLFIVTLGAGTSALFWATYDSATIVSLGTLPVTMVLGAPGATQLGITKGAASRTITLTSGSGLLAAQSVVAISAIGNSVLALTDWA